MKNIIKYIVTVTIGLVISSLIMFSNDIFNQESKTEAMKILTNSYFVPGVLILGFGLLVVASNGGTFDMLIYGTRKFFDLFRKPHNRRITETFYEYRKTKQESPMEFLFMIFVGLGFIVVSLIFLILY